VRDTIESGAVLAWCGVLQSPALEDRADVIDRRVTQALPEQGAPKSLPCSHDALLLRFRDRKAFSDCACSAGQDTPNEQEDLG
jgi:hypothetical protein